MKSTRSLSLTPLRYYLSPRYLNPNEWKGLPADQIYELHDQRKIALGKSYNPNDDERFAILSTVEALKKDAASPLEYVYGIDNFKERLMTDTPSKLRGLPAKRSNIFVKDIGATAVERRRIDQLTRISAYEMPLLAKFRQPYQPTESSKSPLKITYHTDFSDKSTNNNNRKVILTCQLADLGLNQAQQHKFKVLAGNKFNFTTDTFKLKSEQFPEASQNVRWLVDTVNKLVNESKDLKDDFADVPLDVRHMRFGNKSPKAEFPEAWKKPEDAPVARHRIVSRLVDGVKNKKDEEYVKEFSA